MENIAYGIVAGYNNDNLFGTTNLLLINEVKDRYPADIKKIAKLYLDRLVKNAVFFCDIDPYATLKEKEHQIKTKR